MKTYYTLVCFGDPDRTVKARFPGALVSSDRGKIEAALERWKDRAGHLADEAAIATSVRIHGYSTHRQAYNGAISDNIGKHGRVE